MMPVQPNEGNKKSMKRRGNIDVKQWKVRIFLLLLVVWILDMKGQNCPVIQYNYDNTGNRIQRKEIVVSCIPPNMRLNESSTDEEKNKAFGDTLQAIAYPNPAQDEVKLSIIDSDVPVGEEKQIMLLEISGRKVFEKKIKENDMVISLNTLSEGVYIIYVIYKDKKKVFQIIKRY